MPPWVLKELNTLIFNFFWKGKRELVARSCVAQHCLFGGSSVINVKLKVFSLVAQWIKRYASSPASWTFFVTYWFRTRLNLSPLQVFSDPYSVVVRDLPPFYQSLVLAWRAVDGSYSTLVMASGHAFSTVSSMTSCTFWFRSRRASHCSKYLCIHA